MLFHEDSSKELQLCKEAGHFYNLCYTLSILTHLHNRIYPQSKICLPIASLSVRTKPYLPVTSSIFPVTPEVAPKFKSEVLHLWFVVVLPFFFSVIHS